MSEIDITYLEQCSKNIGIDLDKRQLCRFLEYYQLLIEYNEKINLTAITKWEDVVIKHFVDSMSLVKVYGSLDKLKESTKDKKLADIGTGAGFPGIALKILLPDLNITLIDSLEKRIRFLNVVCDKLELKGINAVHGRVEDLAHDKDFRENFDFAAARAVAALPVLSEYCIPFIKKDGFFFAYKSEKAEEEISLSNNALKILNSKIENFCEFDIPNTDFHRTIIVIRKEEKTPDKYPRKSGTPSKKPL